MAEANLNTRFEAFCDGVFAIAITLLVIDIKVPPSAEIKTTFDLWCQISDITPSIFAFLLSFVVILITWVNHHNGSKLLKKTSGSFLYANGFLLLTVVIIPFPTSLLGQYLLMDHAAPAVILYDSVLAMQAIGWILISKAALKDHLGKDAKADIEIKKNGHLGYFAFALYALCSVLAAWFPLAIAFFTTLTWIFWLIIGINIKHEESL
jgi:uncharacterized membrane protein